MQSHAAGRLSRIWGISRSFPPLPQMLSTWRRCVAADVLFPFCICTLGTMPCQQSISTLKQQQDTSCDSAVHCHECVAAASIRTAQGRGRCGFAVAPARSRPGSCATQKAIRLFGEVEGHSRSSSSPAGRGACEDSGVYSAAGSRTCSTARAEPKQVGLLCRALKFIDDRSVAPRAMHRTNKSIRCNR